VVICPTHARVFGDVNDPGSHVAQILKREKYFVVRHARVDTKPNIFYLSGPKLQTWPTAPSLPGGTFMADAFWKKY
jgi:Fe-S-cluster-containing dehydrogenase component